MTIAATPGAITAVGLNTDGEAEGLAMNVIRDCLAASPALRFRGSAS